MPSTKLHFRLLVLLLCWASTAAGNTHKTEQFVVFGTVIEVTFTNNDQAETTQAINALEEFYRDLHVRLHPWLPGPLADLNESISSGQNTNTDPLIIDLIVSSQKLSRYSGGRFNPAIGHLVDLWGFHLPPDEWYPAAPDQITRLVKAHPVMSDLSTNGSWVTSSNRHVKLDFGAIAKGYAVDAGLRLLKEYGIDSAMINAGGDLGVIGNACNDRPWRAAVKHPDGGDMLAVLNIFDGESLATSGGYERFHEYRGEKYAHLINPLTGKPANAWASVTVLSTEGALSDAAATAIAIAAPDEWTHVAVRMGIKHVLLLKPDGVVYLTESMQQRIQLRAGIESMLIQLPHIAEENQPGSLLNIDLKTSPVVQVIMADIL